MSRVLDAAIPGEASTPVAPAQAPVSTAPSDIPFADQQKNWSREEMQAWRMTGSEPAPKTPASVKAPAETTAETTDEPSAPKGETEAATDTADEDQELPQGNSPEEVKKRNAMFAKMRRSEATYKAKAELLEQQRKETPARTTDSAPAPVVKPAPKATDRKEPDMAAYDGTEGKTFGDYMRDVRAFDRETVRLELKAERESERQSESARQREDRVVSEFTERRNVFLKKGEAESTEDHRLRTLQYANASRWFTGQTEAANAIHVEEAILESKYGPQLMQHYHAHREEFAELLKMSRSSALLEIGEVSSAFKKKTPELKPVTRTKAPDPGDRVEASVSASGDPLKAAYAKYDQTKDPKDLQTAMKLENEKEIARLTRK